MERSPLEITSVKIAYVVFSRTMQLRLAISVGLFLGLWFLTVFRVFADVESELWVGLLRADGVIIPIATFHDGKWRDSLAPLDPDVENDSRPLGIPDRTLRAHQPSTTNVMHPTRWYLSTVTESDAIVSAGRAFQYRIYCHPVWAFETDYFLSRERLEVIPHRAVGAVASNPEALIIFTNLDTKTGFGKTVLPKVFPDFVRAEARAVKERQEVTGTQAGRLTYLGTPADDAERAKTPFTNIKLLRSKKPIRGKYYLKLYAEKTYEKPSHWNDSGCKAYSGFEAWLIGDKDKIRMLGAYASLSDCDGKGGVLLGEDPYALIDVNDKVFIMTEQLVYAGHFYDITEIHDSHLISVFNQFGGGC